MFPHTRIFTFIPRISSYKTTFQCFRTCSTLTQGKEDKVRVRYAPSPTGMMHLGGLRTALFNYLFAKKHNGQFILRIEDTDQSRFVEGAEASIEAALKWAGIEYDEGPRKHNDGPYGPYTQSRRKALYQEHAAKLVKQGVAYPCFCTEERLVGLRGRGATGGTPTLYDRFCLRRPQEEVEQLLRQKTPHTIRFRIPSNATVVVDDVVRGKVIFNSSIIDDQVLLKSDGMPTYHLAAVVDDHFMDISHVIRGEEWLASTPKHVLLYQAFGWKVPKFAHLPLLLNKDKSKLSKRQGHVSTDYYRDGGYLSTAVVNFIAFLGWTPPAHVKEEILYMDQLIQHFKLEDVNKGGSVVNLDKLYWINTHHLQRLVDDPTTLAKLIQDCLPSIQHAIDAHLAQYPATTQAIALQKRYDMEYITQVMKAVKERLHMIGDVPKLVLPFFVEPELTSPVAVEMKPTCWKNGAELQSVLSKLLDIFRTLPAWNTESIITEVRTVAKANNTTVPIIFNGLRYLVTATPVGTGIPGIFAVLGREVVLARLEKSLAVA